MIPDKAVRRRHSVPPSPKSGRSLMTSASSCPQISRKNSRSWNSWASYKEANFWMRSMFYPEKCIEIMEKGSQDIWRWAGCAWNLVSGSEFARGNAGPLHCRTWDLSIILQDVFHESYVAERYNAPIGGAERWWWWRLFTPCGEQVYSWLPVTSKGYSDFLNNIMVC